MRSVAMADTSSCCGYLLQLVFPPTRTAEPAESPRSSAGVEAQYQAPVLIPPSPVPLRPREEERETEQRSLLPKTTAPSNAEPPAHLARGSGRVSEQHSAPPTAHGTPTRHSRSESIDKAGSRHRKMPSQASGDIPLKISPLEATQSKGVKPSLEDDVNDDSKYCPTCLEQYSDDNPKTFTECGHHFHLPCLYEWLERKDTCPLCERKITLPGFQD
ncbi:hypothetical protein V8C86DRAFT_2519064 [Haematococcus lacustris]